MRSSVDSVKLGSPRLWPGILTLAASLAFSSALAGCIFVNDDHHNRPPPAEPDPADNTPPPADNTPPPADNTPPASDTPALTAIAPDKALEWTAGEGVGVFVEYKTGGHWHVWASCDTNHSSAICSFDVFATVEDGAKIFNLKGETLESGDVAQQDEMDKGTFHLATKTSAEFDGMFFDATPGALIRIEAYFDNDPDPRILYWYGEGVLHQGAPTNPIDFKPSAP